MKVRQNIILIMITVLISLAVISCSGSTQSEESTSVKPTAERTEKPSSAEKPAGRPEAPASMSNDTMMVMMKLQMLADSSDIEPELALSAEQVEQFLPVLQEWKSAVEADESADVESYVAKIDELMTEEQRAYMPQRGAMGGNKSSDKSDEQMQQQRSMRMDPSDMLSFIIDTLSGTV